MYVLSVLAQDEETQRKGCVGILLNMKPFRQPTGAADTLSLANFMGNLSPVRYVGYHLCIDNPQQSMLAAILSATTHQITRSVRVRFHSGTSTILGSFGFGLYLVCLY
jgi:hypothetical protein